MQLSSVIVEAIAIGCPNLTRLQLAGLQNITDDIALAIAHHCPAMSHVSFRSCHLTDVGVCELAIRCNKLVIVGLAGNHSLTDKSIICLAENCHYIEEVYLSGCARITKAAIAYLQVTNHWWEIIIINTLVHGHWYQLCIRNISPRLICRIQH